MEVRTPPATNWSNGAMPRRRPSSYEPPSRVESVGLWDLLRGVREIPTAQRKRLALPGLDTDSANDHGPELWYAGRVDLVSRKCVAIVGARKVSADGKARAERLARELAQAGVVVVSGLAEGVDRAAHEAAMQAGGDTIAVIGTPIDRAYPAEHAGLQERIYREHLLISQFPVGSQVIKANFPKRNRLMAALTDATVIIEASDTSGSLHQASECAPRRLDRWLFIAKSLIDQKDITWPSKFLAAPGAKVRVLTSTEDVLAIL